MIVADLALKGLSPGAIHKDLMDILGPDAVASSSVTSYLREASCLPSDRDTPSVEGQRGIDEGDQAIMFALDEDTFASIWQLSRLTQIPSTTVYRHLMQSLAFTTRHFRWVLHVLSHAQKAQRVDLSRRLLRMLEVQHDRLWHASVTLDESWFSLMTAHEFIWLP
jgi:RNAse (barnase) inhibitor barstar